jgi:hypothetical protein
MYLYRRILSQLIIRVNILTTEANHEPFLVAKNGEMRRLMPRHSLRRGSKEKNKSHLVHAHGSSVCTIALTISSASSIENATPIHLSFLQV